MKCPVFHALIFMLATSFAGNASAIAMSTADAMLELVITDITVTDDVSGSASASDVLFDGETDLTSVTEDTFGSGVASSIPDGVFFGDGFVLTSASSAAAGPGPGLGLAEILNDGFLDIENVSSLDSYVVDFTVIWSVAASASVMDLLLEDAFADAIVGVGLNFSTELFSAGVSADGLFGPPADGDAGVFDFAVPLGPGESASITAIADTLAFADSVAVVPEPALLSLLFIGALAFGATRILHRCV